MHWKSRVIKLVVLRLSSEIKRSIIGMERNDEYNYNISRYISNETHNQETL